MCYYCNIWNTRKPVTGRMPVWSILFLTAAGQRGGVVGEKLEKHRQAEDDYMSGMKYKDIAAKYNVSLNTVKSWKQRYGWDKKKSVHTKEKVCTQKKKDAGRKRQQAYIDAEEVTGNDSLNSRQQLFCVLYARCFNATKAYQKAYGCTYESAMAAGSNLLRNSKVREEIKRLKQGRMARELIAEEDIVQMYIDILYADINDYIDAKNNMVNLSGPCADGRLVKKVSFGKTDSVELLDKMAALKWLSDHMDLATEKQRAEIELLKTKSEKEDSGVFGDDGFLDALGLSAENDWKDAEDGEGD